MSLLKKLFGGWAAEHKPQASAQIEHEGYLITPTPIPESGQYRLAATISRDIEGETRTHRLIRADLFMTAQEASDAAIRKARQVIAEQGDAMFEPPAH